MYDRFKIHTKHLYRSDWAGNDTGAANDVGGGQGADVGSSSASNYGGGGGEVGSAGWWASEISSREAAAAANTQANPTSNGDSGGGTYYDPRTGQTFANQQVAEDLGYGPSSLQESGGGRLTELVTDRPGYTPQEKIYQDAETQRLMQVQGLTLTQALYSQKLAAEATPSPRDDILYGNAFAQAEQNRIELSSAEHHRGLEAGIPTGPNPYEYSGDIALAILKGTEGKSEAQVTTPSDLSILNIPDGRGIQDTDWDRAMGKNIGSYAGFAYAVDMQARIESRGDMGPYGNLGMPTYSRAGEPAQTLSLPEQQLIGYTAAKTAGWDVNLKMLDADFSPVARSMGFGRQFQPLSPAPEPAVPAASPQDSGVLPAPFLSRNAPSETKGTGEILGMNIPVVSPVLAFFQPGEKRQAVVNPDMTTTFAVTPIASPFDEFQGGLSDKLYGGYGSLFGLSANEARLGVKMTALQTKELTNVAPTSTNMAMSIGVSNVEYGLDKPAEAAVFTGIGVGFGAVARGANWGYGTFARTPLADAAISQGGKWRTALQASDFITSKAVPGVLAGIYGTDVAARSTNMFTDFRAGNVVQRAAPIATFETVPMMAGFGIGYMIPEGAGFAARSIQKAPGKISDYVFEKRQNLAGIERIPKGSPYVTEPVMRTSPDLSGPRRPLDPQRLLASSEPTAAPRTPDYLRGKMREVYGTESPSFVGDMFKQESTLKSQLKFMESDGFVPKNPWTLDINSIPVEKPASFENIPQPQRSSVPYRDPLRYAQPKRSVILKTEPMQEEIRLQATRGYAAPQSVSIPTAFEAELMGMRDRGFFSDRDLQSMQPTASGSVYDRSVFDPMPFRKRSTDLVPFGFEPTIGVVTPGSPNNIPSGFDRDFGKIINPNRVPERKPDVITPGSNNLIRRTPIETPSIRPRENPIAQPDPFTERFRNPQPPTEPTRFPVPGGFSLPGGGGGGSGFGIRGRESWETVNPVIADMLVRGTRTPRGIRTLRVPKFRLPRF